MKVNLPLLISALGLSTAALMSACGGSKSSSSVASAPGVASTTVESSLPTLSNFNYAIDQNGITAMTKDVLAEDLQNIGIISSQLHQFVNFDVKLSNLNGCSVFQSTGYCSGTATFDVELTVTVGSQRLDSVKRPLTLIGLNAATLRSSLDSMIKLELNGMMDHGLLSQLGIQQPGTETPFF